MCRRSPHKSHRIDGLRSVWGRDSPNISWHTSWRRETRDCRLQSGTVIGGIVFKGRYFGEEQHKQKEKETLGHDRPFWPYKTPHPHEVYLLVTVICWVICMWWVPGKLKVRSFFVVDQNYSRSGPELRPTGWTIDILKPVSRFEETRNQRKKKNRLD